MSRETKIQWCDSTLNLQSGCNGCELWNPAAGVNHCYAGTMIDGNYAGKPGWPESFDKPALFPQRLAPALRWADLTGKDRPGKPWLNGLPRLIFLDDMGDTFTEGLPWDWLAEHLPAIEKSPHRFLILTKRPHRMAAFTSAYPFPPNVWAGTSITGDANLRRIESLREVQASVRFLSIEPMVDLSPQKVQCKTLDGVDWAIFGGESGADARPFDIGVMEELIGRCFMAETPVFVKQLGANPVLDGKPIRLRDSHGGDWAEWEDRWKIRQMPAASAGKNHYSMFHTVLPLR